MKSAGITIILSMILLVACSVKPRPIQEGTDNCAFCKMTVMDKRFASEIVTNTGKVYVFDDAKCMKIFVQEETIAKEEIKLMLITDYNDPEVLLPAETAILFTSDQLHTPMNGKTVAIADSGALRSLQQQMEGTGSSVHEWLQ